MKTRPLFGAALVGSLLLLSSGCAEERAPINRVQPNALAKTFFLGEDIADPADDPEFYMRTTVVDVSAGAGSDGLFTASDAQPTTRVRFEMTESLLIARLTYELVDGTDGKGVRRSPDGQIVAAYSIESHFDIRRDYNPSTGEDSNVIVENTSDRAWNEREYFRVDWSRNLVTDAYDLDALSQLGIYYAVQWDPIAYYVNDPNNADAPLFDVKGGYFDVTNKAYAAPQVIHDEEWGDFPACWLIGSFPTVSCNPSEITLRLAFKKVVDTDYEPMEISGQEMDMFGYFTVDRFGYDRRYGVVDDQWRRFAARWNLFERSHDERSIACNTEATTPIGSDPHRDDDANGTEDECEAVGRGSRCDAIVGECTIPFRDRAVKTIAWHVNADAPPDLFDGSREALEAWNQAMRLAVLAGRMGECRHAGEADCEAQMGWPARWSDDYSPPVGSASPAEVPNVFVLCHNPVDPDLGDDPACGAKGTAPRMGDLRYNILNIIPGVQVQAPWGIMVDAEDPLTGEKIAGSANEWAYVLDRAASNLADILALMNGEIPADEFISGENVSDWVNANKPGGPGEHAHYAMHSDELASRKSAFDPAAMSAYWSGLPKPKPGLPPKAKQSARAKALIDSGRLGPGNAALSERLRKLRGTDIEAQMASPEMVQAVGFDPTAPPTADAIVRASPFRRMNPTLRRAEDRARLMGQADRHACRMKAPEPDYLIGLAKEAQKLFPSPDPNDPAAVNQHRADVLRWARTTTSRGVMAHELGHSMGLRHNFEGSFDSLNYPKQYWQLRTDNGENTAECADGNTDGASCVGPRWKDPITQRELDGNISRFSTTSVMDYPGDQNQDMLVAGPYDRAALRFGYGGVLDVWAEAGVTATGSGMGKQKAFDLSAFTLNPGLFGIYYFPPVNTQLPYEFHHYSQYQKLFNVLGECSASSDPDAIDGMKCNGAPMDVVDIRDMKDFISDPDYAAFDWARNPLAQDPQGRIRRGYLFSSDEFADTGNVPCFTDDAGADAYEQIRFLEGSYENRYIFDAFRRNRVQFNSEDVVARIQYKYLDNIQLIAKAYAFGAVLDGDPAQPAAGFLEDGYYGPLGIGSTVAFDLFARMLTRGEPGYYCDYDACGGFSPVGVDEIVKSADTVPQPELYDYDFRIGLGDGRYLHNDFDYSQGYFWGDYQTQVGTYYDKVWAIYYLAEAFDSFISNSKEDFTDSRYKNVNFATIYPAQMKRLFSSIMTNDYQSYAPWVDVDTPPAGTPDGVFSYPTWHDPVDIGTRPPGSFLVSPNYGWNTQLYAMVWGTMFFPTNWSQDFINDARITVKDSDQVNWPADETFVMRDPSSGLTYRAHSVGTETILGVVHQKGTGARMLEWANKLQTYVYLTNKVAGVPQYNADGTPDFILSGGKPQLDPARPAAAEAELKRYIDTIDTFRQLTATFEQGLGEWDLPQP